VIHEFSRRKFLAPHWQENQTEQKILAESFFAAASLMQERRLVGQRLVLLFVQTNKSRAIRRASESDEPVAI
jgi:hypothetical protein